MITVSASKFRAHLFKYLDKVSAGEIIIIQRNSREVARILPMELSDWRTKIDQTLFVNVSEDELMKSILAVAPAF